MKSVSSFPELMEIEKGYVKSESVFRQAQRLVENEMCTMVSESSDGFDFVVEDRFDDFRATIGTGGKKLALSCSCGSRLDCCPHAAAALIVLRRKFDGERNRRSAQSSRYTKKEMIKRVLREREEKAAKEKFKVEPGENIHGFHKVTTAGGATYEITVRDFATGDGYCSCPDFKTNKLGTCKHLIFTVNYLKRKYRSSKSLMKQEYPAIEIYCDPHFDYNITYYYDRKFPPEIEELMSKYFDSSQYIMSEKYSEFLKFLTEASAFKSILVRPEVNEKVDKYFEEQSLQHLSRRVTPDFSKIKARLFDYQKKGITFSLFKKGNVIADEMGLGKTLQAIAIAVLKKDIYGLNKTLVVCPASLKYQWKKEIERFTDERAVIVEGPRIDRHDAYRKASAFFLLANYEAVMRDITVIRQYPPDMIILDEAQKIKNYDTKTSHAVKSIPKKHSLVITGTPLENNLLDLYSIMNFVDPEVLAPQWEFSMNHCYFDKEKKDRITGYFNLQELKNKLSDHVIRREKSEVLNQLPAVQEVTVPVELHSEQAEIHAGLVRSLIPILHKKYKTVYDLQRIQQILLNMRMVCDSTFLVDKETNHSPKLEELRTILLEKLDIKKRKRKVIIFSEWKTMLHLIGKMLKANGIRFVTLSGDVQAKKRGLLIDEFANNPDLLVFLSTEAGGSGLNLQFADTVINFDLPWNPAKKNQRIGRINRIGQTATKLTAINMVAVNSIEQNIANGIVVKEALFDVVLKEASMTEEVDFSSKGRSTFIDQVEKMIQPAEPVSESNERIEFETVEKEAVDGEETEELVEEEIVTERKSANGSEALRPPVPEPQEIETTLNQGMQFLNGIFKMATGRELVTAGGGITIDRNTGEVTMKFRLPGV